MTTAPPGWYEDPVERAWLRFWDGWQWTAWVSSGGQMRESPITAEQSQVAWALVTDQRAPWPGWVAPIALVAALLSAGLAVGLVHAGDALGLDSATARLGLGIVGLHSGLLSTCWLVHKRLGTGKGFLADFGLSYRRGDWWRGLLGSFAARGAAIVLAIVAILVSADYAGSNVEGYGDLTLTLPLVLLFALVAVVMAPFIEELFFRGLLMRSLETILPAPVAIGIQALLFGLAHITVALGKGNVLVVVSITAAGATFGYIARRYHRLAPNMFAHAFFNLVPVIALFVALAID